MKPDKPYIGGSPLDRKRVINPGAILEADQTPLASGSPRGDLHKVSGKRKSLDSGSASRKVKEVAETVEAPAVTIDTALEGLAGSSPAPAATYDRNEAHRVYMRDYMRRRRAAAKKSDK